MPDTYVFIPSHRSFRNSHHVRLQDAFSCVILVGWSDHVKKQPSTHLTFTMTSILWFATPFISRTNGYPHPIEYLLIWYWTRTVQTWKVTSISYSRAWSNITTSPFSIYLKQNTNAMYWRDERHSRWSTQFNYAPSNTLYTNVYRLKEFSTCLLLLPPLSTRVSLTQYSSGWKRTVKRNKQGLKLDLYEC